MVIGRYFFVEVSPVFDYAFMLENYVPSISESLTIECDLKSKTVKIAGKEYDLFSFIKAGNQVALAYKQHRFENGYTNE